MTPNRVSRARATLAAGLALATALAGMAPTVAHGRTYVIPHVLETSGRTTDTQYAFDTTIFMDYAPGLAGIPYGGGATVDLYLFSNTGAPMTNSGVTVCAPCSYALGGASRKVSVNVDDLITSTGSPFDAPVKLGFAIAVVGGADPDGVSLEGLIANAHTSAFDLSAFSFRPALLRAEEPCPIGENVYVLPHVLEKQGTTSNTQYTFDTTIFATYAPGLAGLPAGAGASLDLYLFDESGGAMMNNSQAVCAPCTFALSPATRKASINVDNLITARGPFDATVKLGFGILVVGGADPGGVTLQSLVANAHTSAFDLSLFGFDPVPIAAASNVSAPPLEAGSLVRALSVVPNPARGTLAFAYELARASDLDLSIYDPAGRRVATVVSGHVEAGVHAARWDGRDEAGAAVAPGVYFGRLTGADGSAVTKVVVVP